MDLGRSFVDSLSCNALIAYWASVLGVFVATRSYALITKSEPPTIHLLSRQMLGAFVFTLVLTLLFWHPC